MHVYQGGAIISFSLRPGLPDASWWQFIVRLGDLCCLVSVLHLLFVCTKQFVTWMFELCYEVG